MRQSLYIVGAGGFGREVYQWFLDCEAMQAAYDFSGFIDDRADALDLFDLQAPVLTHEAACETVDSAVFICGLGSVVLKRKLCQPLLDAGASFVSLVHPSARVGSRVKLGRGVVVCPGVTITCDVVLGQFSMINCHTTIGHGACIGEWTTVSAQCDLTGYTNLGDKVFVGSGARFIPGKQVGSGATVGAGSVVIRDVKAGTSVFGNPAREI